MTLIINKRTNGSCEVENTNSTNVAIGKAKVSVGGSFKNTGVVKVLEGGVLYVNNDFLNGGHLSINDPGVIMEALKTTKTVAEFGLEILKRLHLLS